MSLLWIVRTHHLLLLFAIQLVTSLVLIYYRKNKLSYVTELILIFGNLWYYRPALNVNLILVYLAEYILLKALLILIVYLAKRFSFFVLVVITHKEKHKFLYKLLIKRKHFLRFQSRIWNKVTYGIRVKKGMPSMVNKRNTRVGVSFDKDGFPKFKPLA